MTKPIANQHPNAPSVPLKSATVVPPTESDAELVRLCAVITAEVEWVNGGHDPETYRPVTMDWNPPPTLGQRACMRMLQIPAQGLPGLAAKATVYRVMLDWDHDEFAKNLTRDCERLGASA